MNDQVIHIKDVHKSYRMGKVELRVLRGVSMHVPAGCFQAIVGASGSGKSTLLHLMGLLDRPDRGDIVFGGRSAGSMSHSHRNAMRVGELGFVFQFYHLLPELDMLQNVLLPARIGGGYFGWFSGRKQARRRAEEILDQLGLGDRLHHRPGELSGGERQRVAIGRALINRPRVLLADEPTGNLDSHSGKMIMDLLRQCNKRDGQTIVMVTHDMSLAEQTDRVLWLRDGRLKD